MSFEQATRLYTLSALIATALSYSLFFRFIQNEGRYAFRAQTELALAHTIQATLVPAIDLTLAGCEVYGFSLPSAKVGGDLVDALPSPSGDGFAYLVDVAGHGLNAGILMGMVKTAVRTCLAYESSPGTIFDTLNRILPGVKESHMYATCAAFHLKRRDDGRCDITYALAGHPPMLHLSASGSHKPQLSDEQFPLGLLPFAGYQTRSITTARGDLLIAATDGILETAGKNGIDFGAAGLERLAAAERKLAPPGSRSKNLRRRRQHRTAGRRPHPPPATRSLTPPPLYAPALPPQPASPHRNPHPATGEPPLIPPTPQPIDPLQARL